MKKLIGGLLLCQALTLEQCATNGNDIKSQSWLNITYARCLENDLPCECQQRLGTYYSLVLDKSPDQERFVIALSKFSELEAHQYPVRRTDLRKYSVFKHEQDSVSWSRFVIQGKELRLIIGDTVLRFLKSRKLRRDDTDLYFENSVDLMNDAFEARSYPRLESILKQDDLICDCNKWIGRKNLISIKNNPMAWIMELKNDSLHILKITNTDRDPDDPVQTEFVAAFKWR